jgi:glycosyltransferase involved in cell wall biosynthesis
MEHFGISVLESMSAGAVAMAFASGGPMEIIEDRVNGYLWSSRADLQARFLEVLNLSQAELAAIRRAARSTAARFEIQAFNRNLDALLYGDAQSAKIS